MSYSSLFRDLERSVIGYDKFFSRIEEQARRAYSSFPPYSIRKDGDHKYVIELAVAGFGKQDIEIELEDRKLSVKGKMQPAGDANYIFKGIAERSFNREFTLNSNVVVNGATMANGILKVMLEHLVPDSKKLQKINIDDEAPSVSEFAANSPQLLTEEDLQAAEGHLM